MKNKDMQEFNRDKNNDMREFDKDDE